MNLEDTKRRALSVFLVKDKFTSFAQIINPDKTLRSRTNIPNKNATMELFVAETNLVLPNWYELFLSYVDASKIGESASVSAVLLVKTSRRIYAVTFGYGRYLLNTGVLEERFGLRVALNSIGPENFKTMDFKRFDKNSSLARIQSSRESDVWSFGLDIERDLLRGVTGVPEDTWLGTRVTGSDSILVNIPTELELLPEHLERIYDVSASTSYQTKFPWIDKIVEIRDETLSESLDAELIERFNKNNLGDLEMAVPDIIEFADIVRFYFGLGKNAFGSFDLNIKNFRDDSVGNKKNFVWDIDYIRHKTVYAMDDSGGIVKSFPAYNCIQGEITFSNEAFVISNGKWYQVNRDFVTEVNDFFTDPEFIQPYPGTLPIYNAKIDSSEGNYNSRITAGNPELKYFDKELFRLHKAKSGFEFCDIFSRNKDLIHVKRYGQSSKLSHLFAQGLVSARVFLMEKECRDIMNAHLTGDFSDWKLEDTIHSPKASSYTVVYAIIHTKAGDLDLPFFSKVNLREAAKSLKGWGYNVALTKIDVKDGLLRKKKKE